MKSILAGIIAAALLAIGAWAVLDGRIQPNAGVRTMTEGVDP